MNNLYLRARVLHRYLVVIISGITLVMATTGIIMKFSLFSDRPNLGLIRYIHSNLSVLFTIILFMMVFSGLFMYLFPLLKKK